MRQGRLSGDGGDELRQAIDGVSNIDQNVDDVSQSTSRLAISIYVMLAWVAVVTVAIAAVAVVTLRRRRRPVSPPPAEDSDDVMEAEVRARSTHPVEEQLPVWPSSSSSLSSRSQIISVNE